MIKMKETSAVILTQWPPHYRKSELMQLARIFWQDYAKKASLKGTAETNVILKSNFPLIKKKKKKPLEECLAFKSTA